MAARGQDTVGGSIPSNQVYDMPHIRDMTILRMSLLTEADLGMQVLDSVIMTRWKVLPRDQCMGISYLFMCRPPTLQGLTCLRYTQLCCQLYHPDIEF